MQVGFLTRSKKEPLDIKSNTVWNSFGSLIYLFCQWLTTVLVVTLSSNYDNSGILAFAMSVGLIQYSIGCYGIRPFQVSDIEEVYSNSDYIGFRLVTNALGMLICIGYLLFLTNDWTLLLACFFYLFFKFNESFSDVIFGIFQKAHRMDYIGKSQIFKGILSLLGFSITLFFSKNIILAVTVMTASCFLITFLYDIPHARLFGKTQPIWNLSIFKGLAKACAASMISNTLIILIVSSVRQYFGLVEGEAALGIYAAIATPAVVVQAALNFLYMPFIGELSLKYRIGKGAFLKEFNKVFALLLLSFIVLIAILSIIGPPFLNLVFGDSINDYLYIFIYVLISTALTGLVSYIYNALVVVRRSGWMLIMSFVAFLVSMISSIPLITVFFMNGINIAIIFGCLVGIGVGLIGINMVKDKDIMQNEEMREL